MDSFVINLVHFGPQNFCQIKRAMQQISQFNDSTYRAAFQLARHA